MLNYKLMKTFIICSIAVIIAAGCRAPKIISPTNDMTINAGDSISFSAESYTDAIYKWTFDGGAEDASGQNPTVRFDRPGVYDVFLIVVFNDLESGYASMKVTVNDPSPVSYVLTLNDYTVTRDTTDSKTVVWVLEKDGNVILRRNAKDESAFTYFENTSGSYRVWVERFSDGKYSVASNIVAYSIP